jgi:Na+/melibiose symporter-like transporter
MLDVQFFADPRFSAASTAVTLSFFAMFGSLFFLTQYLQFVLGLTAFQAGVRLMPMAAVMLVAAPSSARLVEKVGSKAVVATGLAITAGGLFTLSRATPRTGYGLVLTALVILATGMGLTMAPATESIMGSLPRAKAGVGSAVNDTTRQIGGALGVAILGSLMASSYRSSLSGVVGVLPDGARSVAGESIGAALQIGRQIGGASGQTLVDIARAGFIHAMDATLMVGAAIALVGSLVVLLFLPARAPEDAPLVVEPPLELHMVSA